LYGLKTLRTKGDKAASRKETIECEEIHRGEKTIQIKQGCEKEKLKITHIKQVEDLDKDINI